MRWSGTPSTRTRSLPRGRPLLQRAPLFSGSCRHRWCIDGQSWAGGAFLVSASIAAGQDGGLISAPSAAITLRLVRDRPQESLPRCLAWAFFLVWISFERESAHIGPTIGFISF